VPGKATEGGEHHGHSSDSSSVSRGLATSVRYSWKWRVSIDSLLSCHLAHGLTSGTAYNDIVILPIHENMNGGKMHTYFSWASLNAWVPPIANASEKNVRQFSYSNYTAPPPPVLAPHDPRPADPENPASWVRPDFVIKADDDSFVMLAELEARLRVDLHSNPEPIKDLTNIWPRDVDARQASPSTDNDPLIHWGYMITNGRHQFMAGELYAFTWNLVDWIGKDPKVKTLTIGAEDQRAADWMRVHPRADKVRWSSERCWIYDHPRAPTMLVFFLFLLRRAKTDVL
jgi:hypothetical protein